MTLTPPKTKLSISNPVYGKGRRYAGERQRNDECGELDECLRAPCDRGSGYLSNSRCNRRGYDDLFRVTADVAGLLPRLQPATGPHPVPAPLAGEFCRVRGRHVHRAESASQAIASPSSNGRVGMTSVIVRCCSSS